LRHRVRRRRIEQTGAGNAAVPLDETLKELSIVVCAINAARLIQVKYSCACRARQAARAEMATNIRVASLPTYETGPVSGVVE
jgi:hypothetical protein